VREELGQPVVMENVAGRRAAASGSAALIAPAETATHINVRQLGAPTSSTARSTAGPMTQDRFRADRDVGAGAPMVSQDSHRRRRRLKGHRWLKANPDKNRPGRRHRSPPNRRVLFQDMTGSAWQFVPLPRVALAKQDWSRARSAW